MVYVYLLALVVAVILHIGLEFVLFNSLTGVVPPEHLICRMSGG